MSENSGKAIRETLFIWDFDRTVILDDTDYASVHSLYPSLIQTHLHNRQRVRRHGWLTVMNDAFNVLFEQGYAASDIISAAAANTNLPAATASAIRSISETNNASSVIVSDSNTLFINECLLRNGLSPSAHFADEIHTNVAHIDVNKKLKVSPYTHVYGEHTCKTCPSNLCKGQVSQEIIAKKVHQHHSSRQSFRVVYIGDGTNDFCAVRSLHGGLDDKVLYRKGYALGQLINDGHSLPSSDNNITCLPWEDAQQLEQSIRLILLS